MRERPLHEVGLVKVAWLVALSVLGCQAPSKKLTLHVELGTGLVGHGAKLQVLPAVAEASRNVGRSALSVELRGDAGRVTLELPGACPKQIDTQRLADGATVALDPLFDVGPSERVVGLGRQFEVSATPSCDAARALRTSFEPIGGAALTNVASTPRRFVATTPSALPTEAQLRGVVAVPARVASQLRSELRFRVTLPNGEHVDRLLGVSAVARSSGLPDVGLGHPVLLAGQAWQLEETPPGSGAALRVLGTLQELVPDVSGRYRLHAADGQKLSVHASRFDQLALDCGRSDCHAEIAKSALDSAMTQTLASDLGGCHSLSEPECASACHTTGEPGTPDGGFTHVMSEMQLAALPAEYDDLPQALRRLGGVGCMACHGPTKIPDPEARALTLANDVCAVCHDAPPRYGHLQALASTRMAHADAELATQSQPCARCHTTWGAIGREPPPSGAASRGLGCVTCHDVHPHGGSRAEHVPTQAGLLRHLPLPDGFPEPPSSLGGVSRVCISCHAPSAGSKLPEASAAAIVMGAGGVDPETGAVLSLGSPHVATPRGCLACHDSGPEAVVMGKSHGFLAPQQACGKCHSTVPARDRALGERARLLLARLEPTLAKPSREGPWHARKSPPHVSPERIRALRNVLLVLEDPAADVHHPAYAKLLLDSAEASLSP